MARGKVATLHPGALKLAATDPRKGLRALCLRYLRENDASIAESINTES